MSWYHFSCHIHTKKKYLSWKTGATANTVIVIFGHTLAKVSLGRSGGETHKMVSATHCRVEVVAENYIMFLATIHVRKGNGVGEWKWPPEMLRLFSATHLQRYF